MLLNRRGAVAAIAGIFCLPFGKWFQRATTEVGIEFFGKWYWVSVPGNHKELVIDWVHIVEDRETGDTVCAEVKFIGLDKFSLRKGPPPDRYLPVREV